MSKQFLFNKSCTVYLSFMFLIYNKNVGQKVFLTIHYKALMTYWTSWRNSLPLLSLGNGSWECLRNFPIGILSIREWVRGIIVCCKEELVQLWSSFLLKCIASCNIQMYAPLDSAGFCPCQSETSANLFQMFFPSCFILPLARLAPAVSLCCSWLSSSSHVALLTAWINHKQTLQTPTSGGPKESNIC